MSRAARARRRTTGRFVSVLVVGMIALSPQVDAQPSDVVARVNGAAITRQMVQDVVKSVMVGQPGAPSSKEVAELSDAALESLIELELLYQEARARKLTVSEEEIDAAIRQERTRFASDADFDAALQRSGMSQAQLRQDTRKTLLAERLLIQVLDPPPAVSEAAIRAFYDEHPAEFERPAEARVRHIVLGLPADSSITERIGARGEAEKVRKQILAGADFAALAREVSSDRATAHLGGDLGFVRRGRLAAAADAAAFSLPVGGVSEVIETREGFEILQVTERHAAGKVPFAEARESIARALTDAQHQERRKAFVAKLARKAKIERTPESALAGED